MKTERSAEIEINELSRIVIGKAIQLHKKFGPGLLENPYKECLYSLLKEEGLMVEKEKAIPFVYDKLKIDCGYRCDLLVENKLLLEIKAVDAISDIHIAQTLTYLRLGEYPLGLIINFNTVVLKNGIRRVINTMPR